jgi:hypothetical protein
MIAILLTIMCCCNQPTYTPAHVRLSQPRNQPVCVTNYVPAHVRYSQPKTTTRNHKCTTRKHR